MTQKNHRKHLEIIGANTLITVAGIKNIPAKIDTGADSSSIHAENISVSKDNLLSYILFGKKLTTKNFKVATIRSSNGEEQIRYRVPLSIEIKGRKIRTVFSLSDRSKNSFPVLIGKRTIKNRFIVDVSKSEVKISRNPETKELNEKLKKNPFAFHKKYIEAR